MQNNLEQISDDQIQIKIRYLRLKNLISDNLIRKLLMGNDCVGQRTSASDNGPHQGGKFNVLLICGSLRKKSTNRGLLEAIVALNHPHFNFTWADISRFPIFDEDLEAKGVPADVSAVRKQAYEAHAILFGLPEYNFSIAAPMKNAYDWLSREYKDASNPWDKVSPVQEKIGAMVSSGGPRGGGNAQDHFLHSVSYRKMKILPPTGPAQVTIMRWGGNYFNDDGKLVDSDTKNKLIKFLDAFSDFITKNKKA